MAFAVRSSNRTTPCAIGCFFTLSACAAFGCQDTNSADEGALSVGGAPAAGAAGSEQGTPIDGTGGAGGLPGLTDAIQGGTGGTVSPPQGGVPPTIDPPSPPNGMGSLPDAGPNNDATPEPPSPVSDGSAPPTPTGDAEHVLIPDPAWDCGMQAGIPAVSGGTLAFTLEAQVRAIHQVGATQYGDRKVLVLGDGTVRGPRLDGTLLAGGLDFELTLSDGSKELEQVILLQVGAGQWVYLRNCGVASSAMDAIRVVGDFEAPTSGESRWLNDAVLVGVRDLDAATNTMTIAFYDVPVDATAQDSNPVQLTRAAGVPGQSWACPAATGQRGAELFRETVTLGPIVGVGTGKRGNRTAIPITGGTVTGRFQGSVVNGGADFQLGLLEQFDARYLIRDTAGELVVVRNCGPLGGLRPIFEARSEGPYQWLNESHFRSADPGVGIGTVTIVVHESD